MRSRAAPRLVRRYALDRAVVAPDRLPGPLDARSMSSTAPSTGSTSSPGALDVLNCPF
ncbi:MAG: hypothetical protein OXG35_10815 [Acidobacteria bacterium]|nr:hypothetical protein [Acidobacteriota bacterium]